MSLFDQNYGTSYGNNGRGGVSSPSSVTSLSSLMRTSSLGSSAALSGSLPKVIGDKYRLAEELGRGAFGRVYRAVDTQTGESVAIKQLSLSRLGATQLTGISNEVELLQALNHRNVVKYLGSYRTKTHLYIVMEFVENGALSAIIKANKYGPFPESLVAVYVQQVLLGLSYLHSQGVVHRDIKGANILTTKEGLVKLADFGVAAKLGDPATEAASKDDSEASPAGTPYWMAPEVVELKTVTTASDVWSLGCLAVELLTGQPPYFDLQPMSALYNIVQDQHPPLPMGISPQMQDFLLQCFSKEPTGRPSAKTLLQHPWIAQNRKVLKNTWTKTRKTQADQHSSVASVIERILAADSDDGTLSIDAASPKSSVDASGAGVGGVGGDGETAVEAVAREKKAQQDEFLERLAADPRGTQLLKTFDVVGVSTPEQLAAAHTSPARGMMNVPAATPREEAEMLKQVLSLRITAPPGERNLQQEAAAAASARVLASLIRRDAAMRAAFIAGDGLSGARELLDSQTDRLLFPTLDLLCGLVEAREPEVVDALCMIGILPAALRYSGPAYPPELRLQAGRLTEAMVLSTQQGMHMLVACQGIPFFVGMIDEAPQTPIQLELLRIAVFGCWAVLQQSQTPGWMVRTNQYLRLMAHHGLPLKLIRALPWVLKRSTEVISAYRATTQGATSRSNSNAETVLNSTVPRTASNGQLRASGSSTDTSTTSTPTGGSSSLRSFRTSMTSNRIAPEESVPGLSGQPPAAPVSPLQSGLAEMDPGIPATKEVVEKLAALLESMVNVFAAMSHGDAVVKSRMCQLETINTMFGLTTRMPPHLQLRVVQCVRRLASDPATLSLLETANGLPYLIAQLERDEVPILQAEALCGLQSLCQLNKARQEKVAMAGATPLLCRLAAQLFDEQILGSELAQASRAAVLNILCGMAHAGPAARAELWNNGAIDVFLRMLGEQAFQVSAIEALASWLETDPSSLEAALIEDVSVRCLVHLLSSAAVEDEQLQAVLSPLARMIMCCPRLAVALTDGGLVNKVIDLLKRPTPRTALALLELLRLLYETQAHPKEFIIKYRVQPTLAALARGGSESEQVLVRRQAQNLLKAFQVNSVF